MQYKVVDVFSEKPLKGNPVAVVLDGAGLSSTEMQDVARWTNLSETTFVLPPTEQAADYNVRIYSPTEELPFAGHPSLGTLHALVEAGIVERKHNYVQQCKRGLIDLHITNSGYEFGLQIHESHPFSSFETDALAKALHGLELVRERPPMLVNAGPQWIVVEVRGTETELLSYLPDLGAINALSKHLNATGICAFARHSSGSDSIELRTFVPATGVPEDPVCGSGQAAVAFYRALGRGYTARQGSAIHRDGQVWIRYADDKVWVSGACVTVADGALHLK